MNTLETQVQVSANVVFTVVDDEAVLLEQINGQYFGLDEVGTRMWSLLAEHGRLEPVYRQLLTEYDVDAEKLEQDLLSFVEKLAAKALLKIL